MCRIRRAVIRPPRPGHLADRKRRDAAASLCMRSLPSQSSRLLLQRALLTKILSPLMPINCLVKWLINFWTVREQFVNNSCSKTNWWLFNESNSWTLMFQKACAPNHKSKRRTYCPLQRKSPCCWKPLLEEHQCSWIGSLKKTKLLFEHELNVFGTRIK